jgi:general secretion pathway protein N
MKRLRIVMLSLVGGALFCLGPTWELWAATSSPADILSDDHSRNPVDNVDVGSLKPLARPKFEAIKPLPSGNPLWSVPLSTLSATQARPIFSASRRPPRPAVVAPTSDTAVTAPPPPAEERPALALIGAVVGDGEAIAVLLERSTQKILRLRPGDVHAGWKLNTVESREVTLRKDSRSETLVLPRSEVTPGTPVVMGPGGEPAVVTPALGLGGSLDASFAPFVPRHTPKNGEPDGL